VQGETLIQARRGEDRPQYCAVIGDIVASRAIPDRAAFQQRFTAFIDRLGRVRFLREEIVSGFVVTAGDEFQGLLRTPGPVYELLVRAEGELGVRFRLGVGLGGVLTELRPECIGMDGPAFHQARAALDRAKRERLSVALDSNRPEVDRFTETFIALLDRLRLSWTGRQREVIELMDRGHSQVAAARTLGVSPAAVSQVLRAAGWHLYERGRRDLRDHLSAVFPELHHPAVTGPATPGTVPPAPAPSGGSRP